MTTLTIPPSLGGTGTPWNDGTGPFGMANNNGYGYRTLLFPLLADVMNMAQFLQNVGTSAVNAPGTSGTSTTSMAVGTGTKTFTTQTGKGWVVGQPAVIASTASPTNQMAGPITAYNSATGAMTVQCSTSIGAGTFAAWSVALCGPVQATPVELLTTAGTSTAYTITPGTPILAYTAGQSFYVNFNAASGATPTLTISGVASPPALVRQSSDGTYVSIRLNDIPVNHRSRVTILSPTLALVEDLPPSSVQLGSKNRIINANALITQRAALTVTGAGTTAIGAVDRFICQALGTTVSASFIQQDASGLPGLVKSNRAVGITGLTTTGTTTVGFYQRVESAHCVDMNGKTVVFAGTIYHDHPATLTMTVQIGKATLADNFSGITTLATVNVTVPQSVAVPFILVATLGASDATNGLQVGIASAALPAFTGRAFLTGDWFLDIGATVPLLAPVSELDRSTEFLKCARYYYEPTAVASGLCPNTTTAAFAFLLPVPMRIVPSFVAKATTSSISTTAGNVAIAGTWSASQLGARGVTAVFTRAAGTFTAGDGALLNDPNGVNPFALNSEL